MKAAVWTPIPQISSPIAPGFLAWVVKIHGPPQTASEINEIIKDFFAYRVYDFPNDDFVRTGDIIEFPNDDTKDSEYPVLYF